MPYEMRIRYFDASGNVTLDTTAKSAHRAFIGPVQQSLDVALKEVAGAPGDLTQKFELDLKDAPFDPDPTQPKPCGLWEYEMVTQHQMQDGTTKNSLHIAGAHRKCVELTNQNVELCLGPLPQEGTLESRFHLMIREVS